MSWGRRVKHPSEILKKGEQIQCVLTAIDVENRRISLSIKEFRPNEWEEFARLHHPGDVIGGTVAKVADFGVFVRLPEGLEGLMHVSETSIPRGAKLSQYYQEGQPIRAKILRIEPDEQRIGLSSRDLPAEEARPAGAEATEGGSPEGEGSTSAESRPAEEPREVREESSRRSTGSMRLDKALESLLSESKG
jgi:small subunit ribosomal protein S1